jgi:hypothetical protein
MRMYYELTGTQVLQLLETETTVERYAKSVLSRIQARDKVKAWEFFRKGVAPALPPLKSHH